MPDTITERVARGAALLDEKEPGWDKQIDLDRLYVGSPCDCVLGQLHHRFWKGVDRLSLEGRTQEHGFMWHARDDSGRDVEVDALDAAWRELIESRRAAS
jgi:hypothetical protein